MKQLAKHRLSLETLFFVLAGLLLTFSLSQLAVGAGKNQPRAKRLVGAPRAMPGSGCIDPTAGSMTSSPQKGARN